MKITLTLSALFIVFSNFAQITIDMNDMPVVNDTFRISIDVDPNIDFTTTGPNTVWDYSSLQPLNQRLDTMFSVLQTNIAYNVTFNNFITAPDYVASFGIPGQDLELFGQLSITNSFDFYKVNSDSYKNIGFGAEINGVPLPVKNTPIDTVYHFPLNFNDTHSDYSSAGVTVPSFGYYGREQYRVSTVDGWGAITTPFGTFQALRVKAELTITDTIYMDQFGFGQKLTRPVQREYAWLGKNMGVPILKITTREIIGVETINTIEYQDSLRISILGINEPNAMQMQIYPNPVAANLIVSIKSNTYASDLKIVNNIGKVVYTGLISNQSTKIDVSALANGIYFIVFSNGNSVLKKKFIVQH